MRSVSAGAGAGGRASPFFWYADLTPVYIDDAPQRAHVAVAVWLRRRYAHHGMKGTDLPPMPTGTVWKIGGEAEVSWNVRNNHGGGYQYRLCPASEPLTEACFQKHPLEFVQDKQYVK